MGPRRRAAVMFALLLAAGCAHDDDDAWRNAPSSTAWADISAGRAPALEVVARLAAPGDAAGGPLAVPVKLWVRHLDPGRVVLDQLGVMEFVDDYGDTVRATVPGHDVRTVLSCPVPGTVIGTPCVGTWPLAGVGSWTTIFATGRDVDSGTAVYGAAKLAGPDGRPLP